MEESKSVLNSWVENQRDMMKKWQGISENFQSQMAGGQVLQKGTEAYQEWLANQQKTMNEWFSKANPNTTSDNTTSNTTHNPSDYFKNWMNTQNSTIESWNRNFQQAMASWNNSSATAEQFAKAWNPSTYQQSGNMVSDMMNWNTQFMKNMNSFPNGLGTSTLNNIFGNVTKNTEIYQKLYSTWAEMTKNAQSNLNDAEKWNAAFNPEQYKSIIDKMFGFDAMENARHLMAEYSKNMESFRNQSNTFADTFLKAGQWNTSGSIQDNALNMQNSAIDAYKTLYNNVRSSMAPAFKLMNPSKEQEQTAITSSMVEKIGDFMLKSSQLQFHMYNAGTEAMKTLSQDMGQKVKDGYEFKSFQEFYNEWVSVNDKAFAGLFSTDEYSKLQGDLINLDTEIRSDFEKLNEMMLEPFPIALRKDLDEVYLTNYELRKRVRGLEKKIEALENSMNRNVNTASAQNPQVHTELQTQSNSPAGLANATATTATHVTPNGLSNKKGPNNKA